MSSIDGLSGFGKAAQPEKDKLVAHLLEEMVDAAAPYLSTEIFSQQQTKKINQHMGAVIDEAVTLMSNTGVHQALSFVEQVLEHPQLIIPQRMEIAEHVLLPRAETFLKMNNNDPVIGRNLWDLLAASIDKDEWGAKDSYTVRAAHAMNGIWDKIVDKGLKPKTP